MLSSSSRTAIARSSLIRSTSVAQASQQQQQQQQRFKSANAADKSKLPQKSNFFPVYVHHVSKVVLQHLTANQSDWLVEKGLDRGLKLHPDGTFVLNFSHKGFDAGRIWTSYDATTKQHWLSIYRHKMAAKFLMKDYGDKLEGTKVQDAALSGKRIRRAVDQMIASVKEQEALSKKK